VTFIPAILRGFDIDVVSGSALEVHNTDPGAPFIQLAFGVILSISRTDGGLFIFSSFDMLESTTKLILDGFLDEDAIFSDFILFVDEGEQVISSTQQFDRFTMLVQSGGIDNLRLQAVPVPAAIWLFATGLVILSGVKRYPKGVWISIS